MKVAVLIGSLRKESYNRIIAREYAAYFSKTAEFKEIIYSHLPLYNEDIEEDFMPTILALAQEFEDADALLIVSPEYNYSVPAPLKNCLDWLSRLQPHPLNNLPTAIIGASVSQIGTCRMQYHLRQIGVYFNLHFLNQPEVFISQVDKLIEDSALKDEKTKQILHEHAKEFKSFIKQHKKEKR